MIISLKQQQYLLNLMLQDLRIKENLLESAKPSTKKAIEEDIDIIKPLVTEFKFTLTLKFAEELNKVSTRYLLIKNLDQREYYWLASCRGYTPDIDTAGTFSKEEAEYHFNGKVLSLLDLINGKNKKLEGYAVSVADYISYQKALRGDNHV